MPVFFKWQDVDPKEVPPDKPTVSSTFNVNEYWLKRGQTYAQEQRTPPEYHRLQERVLLDVLKAGGVPMGRVLEIGCGFGRITKLMAETWPDANITALDLSPDQLANARRYCGERSNVRFLQYDFYSGQPFPGASYDTVVAIEVFLHHPPEVIAALLKKLAAISKYIVNLDWSENWPWPTPEHVWIHDCVKVYADADFQAVRFLMPEKIDGKQQVLFIAARELNGRLRQLADEWNRAAMTNSCSANSSSLDWTAQVQRAAQELAHLAPQGTSLILVEDGQWGNVDALRCRTVFPFLEKDNRYWGPPEDDATALRELERLRRSGARFIAFAWTSFWWLQFYAEFHRQLRARFRCCLENERLIVFDLKT
jgi:SAM-dependent methyltransferase